MKKFITLTLVLSLALTSCKKEEEKTDATQTEYDMNLDSSVTMDGTSTNPDSVTVVTDSMNPQNQSDANLPNRLNETKGVKSFDPSEGKYPLSETKWKLYSLNGNMIKSDKNVNFINLDSNSGTFAAYAGCNKLRGSYTMEKSTKLTFSKISATKMACQGNNVETEFLKTLENSKSYTVNADELLLFDGNKEIAKFVK